MELPGDVTVVMNIVKKAESTEASAKKKAAKKKKSAKKSKKTKQKKKKTTKTTKKKIPQRRQTRSTLALFQDIGACFFDKLGHNAIKVYKEAQSRLRNTKQDKNFDT